MPKVILRNSELTNILCEKFGLHTHFLIELSDRDFDKKRPITVEIDEQGKIYIYDGWLDEIKVKAK